MIEFRSALDRVISFQSVIESVKRDYLKNKKDIEDKTKDLETLNELIVNTQAGYSYLETLINEESTKFISKIQDLISYGISTIFYDKDYSCEISLENNQAVIWIIEKREENGQIVTIKSDIKKNGMGIRTVVGCILQFFFILHYEAYPVLFVDEGFSAISNNRMPYFMSFLLEFCKTNGLKVLLVTHDPRIVEYATQVYEVKDHKTTLLDVSTVSIGG